MNIDFSTISALTIDGQEISSIYKGSDCIWKVTNPTPPEPSKISLVNNAIVTLNNPSYTYEGNDASH